MATTLRIWQQQQRRRRQRDEDGCGRCWTYALRTARWHALPAFFFFVYLFLPTFHNL